MKAIIEIAFFAYILVLNGCGGNKLNNTGNHQFDTVKTEIIQSEDSLVIAKNRSTRTEIVVPPEYVNINAKIRKAIAQIADTNNIYEIHHFDDHHLVHIWDQVNRKNTGIVFLDYKLEIKNSFKITDLNPYKCKGCNVIANELGFDVFDLKGKSRKEVEQLIHKIKWDNQGDPTHAFTRGGGSNFGPIKMAEYFNFLIVGTEGSMAAKSMIYIIDKFGFKIDSIERIGEEVWHPRVTDDGKYLAYIYGRAYPDGEEGKVIQHFVIYDIENRKEIYKLNNFIMRGGQLVSNGNYFMFSKSTEEKGMFFRIICDPEKKIFYKKLINNDLRIDNVIKWGYFGDSIIYDKEYKSKLISTWKEDFQLIPFDKYNQN